jgi:hypothetical protein
MSDMTVMIVYPHTDGNSSDKYRVCYAHDWRRFVNGATQSYGFVAFETEESARAYKSRLSS